MKNIVIVGGGASGIACAIQLKSKLKNKAKITIIEKLPRIGKKILMTGNGKCNISNMNIEPKHYKGKRLEIIKKVDSNEIVDFFENLGLMLRVDDALRVYPFSEKATTVLDVFLNQIEKLGIELINDYEVDDIKKTDKFLVYSKDYQVNNYDYLVMATGGMASITNEYNGYKLMKRLGHNITQLQPGLVALKTKEDLKHLSGIRLKCRPSIVLNSKTLASTDGEILFKNDGLSGIAIFELSRYYQEGVKISIDLAPNVTDKKLEVFLNSGESLETTLQGMFHKMVAIEIIKRCKKQNINEVIKVIRNFDFLITDTYGYKTAQITVGGVNYSEINPHTNESLKIKDMYLIGEILDVDGSSGGYNLHYAWGSGIAAANDIIKKVNESDE